MHKFYRKVGFTLGIGLIIASALSLLTPDGSAYAQTCVDDVAGVNNLVCTANDVRVGKFNVITGPSNCVAGTEVEVELEAELIAGAKERYDVGLFVATDGGNAKDSGACYRDYLPGPLDPANTGTPPRTTPFFNGETNDPADICGDIEQNVLTLRELQQITIICQDLTGDGIADVGTCTSWDNNGGNGGNTCTTIDDTIPNTASKCRCEPVQVGNIAVAPQIIVKKETVPDGDPTEFDFTLSGPGPDVIFMLADGETYESGDLTPDTYSVVEAAEAGWSLAGVECISSQDGPLASETNIELSIGELVTCTFNNEQDTLISLASFSAENAGDGAAISWTTAAEIDNAGFNVYSSASANGPWTKVNDALIPAEGSPSSTTSYSLIDESGANYYMLEDIDTKGTTTRHNPVSANGSVSGTNSILPTVFIPYF